MCIVGSNSFALVADYGNSRLRKIDLVTAEVTTIGSALDSMVTNIRISPNGTFALYPYIYLHVLVKIDLNTGISSIIAGTSGKSGNVIGNGSVALFNNPCDIAFFKDNNYILIADAGNSRVKKMNLQTTQVTTLFVAVLTSLVMAPDDSYVLYTSYDEIIKYTLTTSQKKVIAGKSEPGSDDGYGTLASFNVPTSIDVAPDGSFAIINCVGGYNIRKLNLITSEVSTLVALPTSFGLFDTFTPNGISILPFNQYFLTAIDNFIGLVSMETKAISVIAGGQAAGYTDDKGTSASFSGLTAVSVWKCRKTGYGFSDACQVCSACSSGFYEIGDGICRKTCSPGYYEMSNGTCAQCQGCTQNGYYRTGCNATSPGLCVPCTNANF
jgi:DNA-binding beta-propeller fold protein YncE